MNVTRRAVSLFAMALLLSVVLSGCWGGSVAVTLDDAGTIQAARVGDRVIVRLDGNPSTGYTWTRVAPSDAAIAASPLEIVEEDAWTFPGGGHLAGEAGVCVFRYEVVRAGTVTLAYKYARSWETEPIQTFTVTIWARE